MVHYSAPSVTIRRFRKLFYAIQHYKYVLWYWNWWHQMFLWATNHCIKVQRNISKFELLLHCCTRFGFSEQVGQIVHWRWALFTALDNRKKNWKNSTIWPTFLLFFFCLQRINARCIKNITAAVTKLKAFFEFATLRVLLSKKEFLRVVNLKNYNSIFVNMLY